LRLLRPLRWQQQLINIDINFRLIGRGNRMNINRIKRNRLLAEQIIKGLESRNMSGYYAETKEDALKQALELIPKGSSVTNGGVLTADEIGLIEVMKNGEYNYCDRNSATPEDKRAAELFAYDADVFLGSVNAITEDGILVNIDGNANRVSAYAYGPRKLVLLVGLNKVASDTDAAMKRARNEAAPINAQRLGLATPCVKIGRCMDCKVPDTICCQFLITRYSKHKDRIHVILINDELGF